MFSRETAKLERLTHSSEGTSGGSTACIQTPNAPNPKLSADVTDQLTTCEPWGLTAVNGPPPYTIYLTAFGSKTITVVEMGDTDNTLIYPDRVEPNTKVIGKYTHDFKYLVIAPS